MGLKVCIEAGCWNATLGTRCKPCETAHQRARNADPARKPRRTRAYMDTVIPVGAACWCCGSTSDLTWHHVNPLATQAVDPGYPAGGPTALVPMCRPCNSSIGARRMAGLTCPMHGGVVSGG